MPDSPTCFGSQQLKLMSQFVPDDDSCSMFGMHASGPQVRLTLQFGAPSVIRITYVFLPDSPMTVDCRPRSVAAVGVPPLGTRFPITLSKRLRIGPFSPLAAKVGGSPLVVGKTSAPGAQPSGSTTAGYTAAP